MYARRTHLEEPFGIPCWAVPTLFPFSRQDCPLDKTTHPPKASWSYYQWLSQSLETTPTNQPLFDSSLYSLPNYRPLDWLFVVSASILFSLDLYLCYFLNSFSDSPWVTVKWFVFMLFLACNELSTSLSCWVSCSTSLLFFFWYCLKHIYCDMLCTALKTWDHWPGFWMCDLLGKHLVFCLINVVKSQTIQLYIRSGETIMLTAPAHNQSIKSVITV